MARLTPQETSSDEDAEGFSDQPARACGNSRLDLFQMRDKPETAPKVHIPSVLLFMPSKIGEHLSITGFYSL